MSAATITVCIFAWQVGLISDVPLADVHSYREAVIVPCHWTYEKSRAYWWYQQGEYHPSMPLPPAQLPKEQHP